MKRQSKRLLRVVFTLFFFIIEINFHFWEVVFSVFLYLWQVQINVALNNIAICRNKHSSISLSKKKKKKNHLFNQIIVYIWRTIIINTSKKRCTSFTIMKTYNLQLSYLKFLYHTYCVMSCFYPFVMFLSICNTKSCVMSCFYPSVILLQV